MSNRDRLKHSHQIHLKRRKSTHSKAAMLRMVHSSPPENRLVFCLFAALIGNRLKFMLMSTDISLNSLHSIKERSKGPKARLFSHGKSAGQVQAQPGAGAQRLSFKTC